MSESLVPEMTPPLPRETPPPLPASTSMPSMMSSLTAQPPPSMYHGYYQQYMQWYMSAQYAAQAAASGTPQYTVPPLTSSASTPQIAPVYGNNMQPQNAPQKPHITNYSTQQSKVDNSAASSASNKASAIKFNLKFNNFNKSTNGPPKPLMNSPGEPLRKAALTNSPPTRKSRFDNLANITAEQTEYQNSNQKPNEPKKSESIPNKQQPETTQSKAELEKAAADIVFDIHKWPPALKTYCTKVYQHYQKVHTISEDQVTKYLQQRITETFKQQPDLNIAWHMEAVPEIEAIRKVAPLSQVQIMQQKKQEAAIAAAKAAFANKIQMKQKQHVVNGIVIGANDKNLKRSDSKTPKKRKISRSRSPSSSQSSRSSSSSSDSKRHMKTNDFISLSDRKNTNKQNKKGKKKTLKNIQINNMNGKRSFFPNNGGSNNKLENRLKKNLSFSNENQSADSDGSGDDELRANRKKQLSAKLAGRQQRFQKAQERRCFIDDASSRKNLRNIFDLKDDMDYTDSVSERCIGQCQDLEKEYLRLTGPPEPHAVRPLSVLKKSLEYVLKRYADGKTYRYICEQLKSIRQDLSVQWIENEFTIEVYEQHARIAIKNKDRDEFNQCQSKLKSLYAMVETKMADKVSDETKKKVFENNAEFLGYRLLYNMLTKSHNDLNQVIKEIKHRYSGHVYLNHLLSLRTALHLNNYVKFFRLYAKSNELSKCLIDLFTERVRKLALKTIVKSYRPSIKVECVAEMLAYESYEKCKEDLLKYQLIIQSVPIVTSIQSDSASGSSPLNNTNSSNKKSFKNNKSTPTTTTITTSTNNNSSPGFEEVLDCKSCTLQGF